MRGKWMNVWARGAGSAVPRGAIVRSARSGRLWNSERGGGNAAPWLPASGTTLPVPAPKQVPPLRRPRSASLVALFVASASPSARASAILCPQCAAPGECACPRVPPVLRKSREPPAGYTSVAARASPHTDTISGKIYERPALRSDPKRPTEPSLWVWRKRFWVLLAGCVFWLSFDGWPARLLSLLLHLWLTSCTVGSSFSARFDRCAVATSAWNWAQFNFF